MPPARTVKLGISDMNIARGASHLVAPRSCRWLVLHTLILCPFVIPEHTEEKLSERVSRVTRSASAQEPRTQSRVCNRSRCIPKRRELASFPLPTRSVGLKRNSCKCTFVRVGSR